MASFLLMGEISPNIHLVRLNIGWTDRQKVIIPLLPSPPTLASKPSGSHFSVTTEEEDRPPPHSSLITL